MKLKKFLFVAATLLLCCSMSACGFVDYVEYAVGEDKELEKTRQGYLEQLAALSSEDWYDEEGRRAYLLAMLDAQNELSECQTLEELEAAFEKHTQIILGIPTNPEQIFLSLVQELKNDLSEGVYREAEKAEMLALIEEYLDKLEHISDYRDAEVLLNEFKTFAAKIKTDEQLYAVELTALKKELSVLGDDIDYSLYRTAQRTLLENTVKEFRAELAKMHLKEECFALYDRYAQMLPPIPKAEELLTEEREAWQTKWAARLFSFAKAYGIGTETEMAEVLSAIAAATTVEQADALGIDFLLTFADQIELPVLRTLVCERLDCLVRTSRYRESERNEIESILARYKSEIMAESDPEAIFEALSNAKAELLPIKTNDELWAEEDQAFLIHMTEKYQTQKLTPPETLSYAKNQKELAAIIDYYAFYQLDGKSFERATFRVRLDFAHNHAEHTIRDVYWYCELLRSAVGITGYFETDSSQFVITLIPYELASVSNTENPVEFERYDSQIEYSSNATLTDRASDFDDFPYYELAAGKEITVWNSQQLWYALEHGYLPVPVKGSAAEKVLERAKEILRVIIKEGMTIEEKVFAIYSWYGDNVTYDYEYEKFLYVEDREHFPDRLAATLKSFHAEGAFFDHLAVCCSYAKSCLILMRLEGIEAYRVILHEYKDNAIDNLGRLGYGSHAIIALRASDGKFYYCDVEQSSAGPDLSYEKYHQVLVTEKEQHPYAHAIDLIWHGLDWGATLPTELLWNNLTYEGQSIFVETEEELLSLLEKYLANGKENSQINIFQSPNADFSMDDILDSYGNLTYHKFRYGDHNEYMIHLVK